MGRGYRGDMPADPSDRVHVRRVYDPPADDDGRRVLVDRLWPRGVRKEDAALDRWAKAVAPSTELRRWYGHEPSRFEEFATRYRDELEAPQAAAVLEELAALAVGGERVTLLTATRDLEHSHVTVLATVLRAVAGRHARGSP